MCSRCEHKTLYSPDRPFDGNGHYHRMLSSGNDPFTPRTYRTLDKRKIRLLLSSNTGSRVGRKDSKFQSPRTLNRVIIKTSEDVSKSLT